ncbi:SAM-dependent methyltransferase [Blastococcus sp. SYSU D00922]
MAASERLAWTAEVVAPAPADRVLEVGCGHGVLLALLAGGLTTGEAVGVDRSPTMVAAATRRNRAAVDVGRVRLLAAPLVDAALDGPFDVVVSFNVRAFWTAPAPEWDVVDRLLAPDGRVLVAFSVMGPGTDGPIEESVRVLAGERGLRPVRVHRGATQPYASVAVELRRA